MHAWLILDGMLLAGAGWLAVGLAGLLALRRHRLVARLLFPLGGVLGAALAVLAGVALARGAAPEVAVLPVGLPGLPVHLRLDALSAFFLLVLGAAGAAVSVFAAGYFRRGEGTPPGLLCLEYHLFLASLAGVLLADDAYAFMVMWETMALTSYFLVTANHRVPEVRGAGYLYVTMARTGALALLLCFGVLQAGSGAYTFDAMRAQHLGAFWASTAFLLATAGFGAKSGLLPLHAWLPEAHPAAPSPVSALMSGVMLNAAVYGVLRVSLDLLHVRLWWWGAALMAVGLATALFGVVFAASQTDMKRLLAYSSIENMGVAFTGLGLALLFAAVGMAPMAALALAATFYHVASHSFFKCLLFLGTGCVFHATSERSLGRLGGLIRRMPWVAWLTFVGVLASAGLPPLGGFVAEWLLLQSFLFAPALPVPLLTMLVPVVAAIIALVSALAGYTMVKFFGVVFLGQAREPRLDEAHDAGGWERAGLGLLAAGCVALGLAPVAVIGLFDPVTRQLAGAGLAGSLGGGWLLAPGVLARASYGPLVFLLGVLAVVAGAFLAVRWRFHGRVRRGEPWACGFPVVTARMQDTAEGFGQPIRQIFEPFFLVHRDLPTAFDEHPRYEVRIDDPFWHRLYLPVVDAANAVARLVGRLQRGRIAAYLLYSFGTLVATLVLLAH